MKKTVPALLLCLGLLAGCAPSPAGETPPLEAYTSDCQPDAPDLTQDEVPDWVSCRIVDGGSEGELLLAEQVAEGEDSAYGLFITTVDGETAQDSLRQWWCITKGGERVETGVDATPIADGDHFELTFTTGYDMALTQTDAYDHAS